MNRDIANETVEVIHKLWIKIFLHFAYISSRLILEYINMNIYSIDK